MSRSERRTLKEMRENHPQHLQEHVEVRDSSPMWASIPLKGFGLERVPKSLKWFAYQCCTDGTVKVLTPLYDGQLRGESKPAATGRLKMALLRSLGGLPI